MPVLAAFALPHPPLILPRIGHGREHEISSTVEAYHEVARRVAELEPETIVLSSPHSPMFADYLHIAPGSGARGTFAQFGDESDGSNVRYDEEFVDELSRRADRDGLRAGTFGGPAQDLDWGVLVPLHFIEESYRDFRLVRISLSGLSPLDHYHLGQLVLASADALSRRVVMIASGDLSHKLSSEGPYGFAEEGSVFDALVCETFQSGELDRLLTIDPALAERAAECGLRSFQIMAGTLDRTPITSELLCYEGPFGVGYGIGAFTPIDAPGTDEARAYGSRYEQSHEQEMRTLRENEDPLVRLARTSLEHYVHERTALILPDDTPAELLGRRSGAFVSIKKHGQLRGCIGTIEPVHADLAYEIIDNAVSAGCRDPRFPPVSIDELDELVYDVDVMGTPEPVTSIDELDPSRFGVIVSGSDGRRGLLLPDLDGVDSVEDQVSIAARKGGIDPSEPGVRLERFSVERHA
ncbi:AMMECR1 domain protein [Coriobacterium glomerans PW2]|uniref:AMMECR1 domain protein n=1 Tax=Coriobacterium glomerans (strain ATCC 49209 / DSM 20642 / JCM 10262 / PW2) TaxID=700015 RepID=F2N981_CORGP|nr:AmmeMemoRadiSam system protein A [Coriobacterium glomerans]AEB07757.1 AMMECR1 domain protein [Coriobacterium glomerans PW2]